MLESKLSLPSDLPPPAWMIDGGPVFQLCRILDVYKCGCGWRFFVDWVGYGPKKRLFVPWRHILDENFHCNFCRDHPETLGKTHLSFFFSSPVFRFQSWLVADTMITRHHLELYLKPGYQLTKVRLLSPAEWHLGIWLNASCVFWTFSWHVFLGRVWGHCAVVVPVWIYGQLSILFSDFLILCCSVFLLTVLLDKGFFFLLGLAASHLLMGPKQYTSQ